MAFQAYYWLGKIASTGSGNVNNPLNWTTLGPSGSGAGIPPSATTIPGNNDFVYFTRFIGPGGTVYPIHSPGGTLGSGLSGSTAMLQSFEIFPDCPVAVGICGQAGKADEPFRVNVYNYAYVIQENTGVCGDNYIYFNNNKLGAAPPVYDPLVYINSKNTSTNSLDWSRNRISGFVGSILVSTEFAETKSNLFLQGLTATAITPYSYTALFVRPKSAENIYISRDCTINSLSLSGNSRTYVSPGFGTTGAISIVGSAALDKYPHLEFVVGRSGACAGDELVTRVERLSIRGFGAGDRPTVDVNHGIGITYYSQDGGLVTFSVPPGNTMFMCTVDGGEFFSGTLSNSRIISNFQTLTLGKSNYFTIKNNNGPIPGDGRSPNISMKGKYDVETDISDTQDYN